MTRDQAFEYYKELKETGKFDEFRSKHPWEMTRKEQDLFYFDDGKYMYDPFEGDIDEVISATEYGPNKGASYEKLKASGMLKGMKTKAWSELSEEEQKLFSDDNV